MADIKVEFYGIPRQRAGVAMLDVQLEPSEATLGQLMIHLAAQLPDLATDCIVEDRLADGFVANVNGTQFVQDPGATLPPNCSILIMSADAGG